MKKLRLIIPAAAMVVAGLFVVLKADFTFSGDKVKVCHNGVTIEISVASALTHIAHGDLPYACDADPCVGVPNPDLFCPTYVDEVCGCDGNTYSNGCFATAAGVRSYTPGACGASH